MREVKIFRPFCTDPVARDPRVRIFWKRSPLKGILYQADLTGNEKVKLYWYDNDYCEKLITPTFQVRHEPRVPTALCVNVLLSILQFAQERNTSVLKFNSFIDMGKKLRIRVMLPFYKPATMDAIRLWQLLRISWPYCDMPPPIKSFVALNKAGPRNPITIELNERWLEEIEKTKRTVTTVQLPLPMQGTPLNMILYTLSLSPRYIGRKLDINEFTLKVSGNKDATLRVYMPLSSWLIVRRWYEVHGGDIDWRRTPYSYGIKHNGEEGLIPSRTFVITSRKRPRAEFIQEPKRWR